MVTVGEHSHSLVLDGARLGDEGTHFGRRSDEHHLVFTTMLCREDARVSPRRRPMVCSRREAEEARWHGPWLRSFALPGDGGLEDVQGRLSVSSAQRGGRLLLQVQRDSSRSQRHYVRCSMTQ